MGARSNDTFPGMRLLALAAALWVAPAAAQAPDLERAALPSALAAHSLLLDAARAGERLVAVGQWGHVVLSDDRGVTWRQARRVPTRVTLTSVHFVDARRGWAVGHDAVILHSEDGGEVWQLQHAAPQLESPLLSVWLDGEGRGLAVGAFSLVLETRDAGQHWESRPPPGGEGADLHLNAIFPAQGGALMIAAESGTVYRARSPWQWEGDRWETSRVPYSGSLWGGLRLPDGATLVFGMRGHVFRSAGAGDDWKPVETGTDKSLAGGTLIGERRVVLVGLGGVVLTSDDAGRSFDLRTRPGRRSLSAVRAGPPGKLAVFGEIGAELIDE